MDDHVCRLLIIEDGPSDQMLLRRMLSANPATKFDIVFQSTGEAGLAKLRAERFDCLLLDYRLPDMTGAEFLTSLTDQPISPPVAIILITGQGSEDIAVEAMRLGVQDYIVKDKLDHDLLVRAIARAIEQLELRQALVRSVREISAANVALAEEVAVRQAAKAALQAAKDAAEQASSAKSRFVALVSHELRTPLNGVLGYAQLLSLEGELSPRQQEHVRSMTSAGRHLLQLIERVLDFSRIEAGQVELHPIQVSVREFADGCIDFVSPSAAEKSLDLRLVFGRGIPNWLFVDPTRLRQVIVNLLGNAIKFTAQGTVELRLLACQSGGLRVEIADTGRGIGASDTARLFHEFERLTPAATTEGAGLGLAISMRFMRLMGGDIGYVPNPSGGSIFWVELPASACVGAPVQREELKPMAPEGAGVGAPLRVLVVDDIETNRDIAGAFVRAAGHYAAYAQNGWEGWLAASTRNFDVILMDVRMPDLDGLEATRRIRALPGPRGQIPVIALSAQAFAEQIAECREAGMSAHVSKPVDYDTLMRAIREVVAQSDDAPAEPGQAQASAEQALSVMDQDVLRRTMRFLTKEQLAHNLEMLRGRIESMRSELTKPAAGQGDVTGVSDVAHTLAGSAGTFGFARLSDTARRFERALIERTPDLEVLRATLLLDVNVALAHLDAEPLLAEVA